MTMGFSWCGLPRRNTDDIDGGVVTRNSGDDSPKVIESTEIISYGSEFSFISSFFDEESGLAGKVYKLSAVMEDDTVKAKFDWHDRAGNGDKYEFQTDSSFMTKLQKIVSKYDLAKDSVVLLEQLRTIDKKRLKDKVCHLDNQMLREVDKALGISLELYT